MQVVHLWPYGPRALTSAGPSVTDTRPRPQAGSVCVREETRNDRNMKVLLRVMCAWGVREVTS